MTIKEAEQIRDNFDETKDPTEEELFVLTEAMDLLIAENHSPHDMLYLGGLYYAMKRFDLALKYYEMAASHDHMPAFSGLGYIWYYGRTGMCDYEKAFKNFSRAADLGDIQSAYKVADMYRNGYYVEKNYEKYKEMIKELYPMIKDARYLEQPLPEIFIRLAGIYVDENRIDEAVELYLYAKRFLEQRIAHNNFWGNFNIMQQLIEELYDAIPFDYSGFDFYDMYYLLKKPVKIRFRYNNKYYNVETAEVDEECAVCFEGKWYRTRNNFFINSKIGEKSLSSIYDKLYMFEVLK